MDHETMQAHTRNGIAWGVLAIAFFVVMWLGVLADLITRWGGPVILELHLFTIVWLVAFVGWKGSLHRMERVIDKLNLGGR